MNILITLPKSLIEKIIAGEKNFEMRKCVPKLMKVGEDGFFVVEKGTDNVRCWCRCDGFIQICFSLYSAQWYSSRLCVPYRYIMDYANGENVFLWKIGKVKVFECLKRYKLLVGRNPQQFAYCPLSYGESY